MGSESIKFLKGFNGQVELFSDKVIIKRKGFRAKLCHGFTKGEKTIYINKITAVQIKKPGLLEGYIQFTIPGGIESKKGLEAAVYDENTVTIFGNKEYEIALSIKSSIEKIRDSQLNASGVISNADELRKFKQLYDDGIISKEDFEQKKKQLLGI